MLALFLTLAVGSTDDEEPEAVDEVEEVEEEPEDSEEVFAVGDTVAMGELEFTLHSVRWYDGEFVAPDEGKGYLLIDATVDNKSDEGKTISSLLMFSVYDDEHRSADVAVGALGEIEGQLDGDLGAGRKMRGELPFEVPADSEHFELLFEPDFLGFGQAIFVIQADEIE